MEKKLKRAQATIFIIIAIVIVVGMVIFFLVRQSVSKPGVSSDTQPIYSFVEECIKQTGKEVIYSIGETGGYYQLDMPYYYIDGKTYIPTKEEIEKEIAKGINLELSFCFDDFKNFPDYQTKQGETKTLTKILDDQVILNVNYPLTITKGEKTTQFSQFNDIKIPIRLGIIYTAADEVTQNQLKNQKYSIDGKVQETYCLTCLSEIATANDVDIDTMDYDEETVIFFISDEISKINEQPFIFIFANKYQTK